MEAILLVGGQGTRLRPLTLTTPKPMLPVANHPCTAHQIAKAKAAGITRVVLGTSYKAEVFEEYFGDGSAFGIELRYVVEAEPLGTGGAIRNVLSALESGPNEPVVILNGDVLSGHDLAAQVAQHRARDAEVTLHLIDVADPRPFGLVPTDRDGRVLQFLEKPTTPAEIVTHQVNAGCYVFKRSVIDQIPTGRPVSVERETFPGLLASGARVLSYLENAYWLDLGNPLAYAQGSRDLVEGRCPSPLVAAPSAAMISPTAQVASSARVDGGSALGELTSVAEGAIVTGSVVMAGVKIGPGAVLEDSVIGAGATIAGRARLVGAVVGAGARIGADNELLAGARVWPAAELADLSVRFSPPVD